MPNRVWSGHTGFRRRPFRDGSRFAVDVVLVPRIARRLRAIRLPAGHLPTDHHFIVISVLDPDRMIDLLEDATV